MLDKYYLEWANVNSHFLGQLQRPVKKMRELFARDQGVRAGEAAVVSRKVHTIIPECPEIVQILVNNDAGEVFYQREQVGEIIHIDIFHQLGKMDPVKVAAAIRKAIEVYNFHVNMQNLFVPPASLMAHCADLIDIQTAVGGGRVTGTLHYGQKQSLRRAHENHVHIAALLPDELLPLVFYILIAVEREIVMAGLELRRNKGIHHVAGSEKAQMDLSPYAANTDSYLRENRPVSSAVDSYRQIRIASELLQEFFDIKDLVEILQHFQDENRGKKLQNKIRPYGNPNKITQKLINMGLVEQQGDKLRLSSAGGELKRFLVRHAPDVEAQTKRLIRQLPKGTCHKTGTSAGGVHASPLRKGKKAENISPGDWIGDFAVPDTVVQALRRCMYHSIQPFNICRGDFRQQRRIPASRQEICLLIDASASMTGSRMQAAKYLVKHLMLTCRGRIAVIVFQEKEAQVTVPFTRDYRQVEAGLKDLRAFGATPLSIGIRHTLAYLDAVHLKNPSILLITDGVPTIGEHKQDPVEDAIVAAEKIKEKKIHFRCIGLQPHQFYLKKVAEAAGGVMYAVQELEKNALVNIAWQDKNR